MRYKQAFQPDDQAFYDLMFSLRATLVFLARESREARERHAVLLVRALRFEARARCLEMERDYWKALVMQHRAVKLRSNQKRRAA